MTETDRNPAFKAVNYRNVGRYNWAMLCKALFGTAVSISARCRILFSLRNKTREFGVSEYDSLFYVFLRMEIVKSAKHAESIAESF